MFFVTFTILRIFIGKCRRIFSKFLRLFPNEMLYFWHKVRTSPSKVRGVRFDDGWDVRILGPLEVFELLLCRHTRRKRQLEKFTGPRRKFCHHFAIRACGGGQGLYTQRRDTRDLHASALKSPKPLSSSKQKKYSCSSCPWPCACSCLNPSRFLFFPSHYLVEDLNFEIVFLVCKICETVLKMKCN